VYSHNLGRDYRNGIKLFLIAMDVSKFIGNQLQLKVQTMKKILDPALKKFAIEFWFCSLFDTYPLIILHRSGVSILLG